MLKKLCIIAFVFLYLLVSASADGEHPDTADAAYSADTSNMRMLLLENGDALSYCISNGKVYASAYGLAKLKGCTYSSAGHAFASKNGVIYGFMEDNEILISAVGNDLVDLQRAAEMLGLVFEMGENNRAIVHQIQTASELEAAVVRIQQNGDYRKYEMFINDYYTIEYAGTEIVGNILSFEWITRIFEKLTGVYDQTQFNAAFTKIILHSGSYEQAVKSYKDIESAIATPLNMLNWFEDAVNEEDGVLFKLLKALGDSDNEAALQVRQWGNLFYESVYSDPVTSDLMELADLWEGISEVKLDKNAKEIFGLVNYCSAIANADELTILGMRSVFQDSENQYMRNGAQRIDDVYANNVTGGLKAGAQDWFVKNLNKQIGESAVELLKEYGVGNDWEVATEVIKTVWGLVDEHITHSSDYVDQVALNSVLLQLQLEEYNKLVHMDPVTADQLKEYQAVALLYLRTLLAIYDNGYFDTDSNKAQVVSNAQADLLTLLQFSYDEYATAADNEEFLNRLINNHANGLESSEEQIDYSEPVGDIISALSIGDYVEFGNDHMWQVINMQDGVATLFYSGCFQGVFDASIHMEAHTISLTRYHCYGSATWEYSDVRQWLNSREPADTSIDVAFDYSNLAQGFSAMGMSAIIKVESGSYAYANRPGFLSSESFSDLEYWLLEPTEITSIVPYTQIPGDVVSAGSFNHFRADMCTVYTENVGQTQTIDRMFLLNAQEIQAYLIENGISPYTFTNGKSYPAYWLRDSVYTNLAGFYFYYGTEMLTVANNGASSTQADMNAYIRPACNINLRYITALQGDGTAEAPYTFEIDPAVANRSMDQTNVDADVASPSHDDLVQALTELLDTERWMKTASRDVLATHYQCVDMNGDGINEVIIYGISDIPAFEIYTYDNGVMKLIGDSVNSCDLSHWFNAAYYVSICDGKYVRARTSKGTVAIQADVCDLLSFDGIAIQHVQAGYRDEVMLISISEIVNGIEIGSEEDMRTRQQGLSVLGNSGSPATDTSTDSASSKEYVQSLVELTADDYLGYWEIVKAEQNGTDITQQVVAYSNGGIAFNTDGALLYKAEVEINHNNNGDVTVTPYIVHCTWTFQPDGSMDLQWVGRPPYTLRHDGVYLHGEDQGIQVTYARAEAPDVSTSTTIPLEDMENLLGRWTLAKLVQDGIDVSAEALAIYEVTIVFEVDCAMMYVNIDDGVDAPSSESITCTWYLTPNGNIHFSDGQLPTLHVSGDTLVNAYSDYAHLTFVREKQPQVTAAFDAAFTHTANKIDKALCLQSAYAAKKVYSQNSIADFLIGLGFDSASIEQHDYFSNAAHSVAITMANRVVNDENGKPVTLYAVIIRGTEGAAEWISDFDIGNGDVALGFDKATTRVMKHFAQYVKNNPPLEGSFTNGKYKVWTCGHSRGAAVANLLAGKYLSQYVSSDNVYAYGFAVPYVDKNATRYSNIFNFNIAGDFVPYVPFNSWGFERYGLTIYNPDSEIGGVTVNTESNIRLMLSFLSDSIPTQQEYVSRTKEFLQILEGDPAAQEIDLSYMVKGILSTCSTAGTAPELIIKLDANEDLEFIANLISPGILPDDFVYTTEDFITTYNNIGASHAMDTYLLWIEDICAAKN